MKLNLKIFTFFITWFVSLITFVVFKPTLLSAKETHQDSLSSKQNDSLLLAQSQQQELDAFFSYGKYTYCDAKVLADYWGQSTLDAKARIGRKILSGQSGISTLDQFQANARNLATSNLRSRQELCFFEEKGYVYEDAVALARYWGHSTPWEAKLQAEKYLILGQYQIVRNALSSGTNM